MPLRKKRKMTRSGEKPPAPLPVPLANRASGQKNWLWSYYDGVLQGSSVIINCRGDADSLLTMGCFGKRLLAKASSDSGSAKGESRRKKVCGTSCEPAETNESRMSCEPDRTDKQCVSCEADRTNEHSISCEPDRTDEKHGDPSISHKNDDIKIEDCLCLSLEEAFFLSYALGCLFVRSEQKELDIATQWTHFCILKSDFHATYAAYHHFRTKGWVTREGVKFGTDFVLYNQGPSFYHASYAVKVVTTSDPGSPHGKTFTWQTLTGLNRLVSSVAKKLLFCYVTIPKGTDLSSPKCLQEMVIDEVVVGRWSLTKEKDEGDIDVDSMF